MLDQFYGFCNEWPENNKILNAHFIKLRNVFPNFFLWNVQNHIASSKLSSLNLQISACFDADLKFQAILLKAIVRRSAKLKRNQFLELGINFEYAIWLRDFTGLHMGTYAWKHLAIINLAPDFRNDYPKVLTIASMLKIWPYIL